MWLPVFSFFLKDIYMYSYCSEITSDEENGDGETGKSTYTHAPQASVQNQNLPPRCDESPAEERKLLWCRRGATAPLLELPPPPPPLKEKLVPPLLYPNCAWESSTNSSTLLSRRPSGWMTAGDLKFIFSMLYGKLCRCSTCGFLSGNSSAVWADVCLCLRGSGHASSTTPER
jgi:hypothetical protein